MTEHPLTDDICLAIDDNPSIAYMCFDWKKSMRAAADWQLAQCLDYIRTTYGDEAMIPFMEAMRPTTTQEDN